MAEGTKVVGRMLTINEVADRLGISERTARRLIAHDEFPVTPVKVGRQYRFSPVQVELLVNGDT